MTSKISRLLRDGRHPLGALLHPDAPPVDDRSAEGPRCGNCRFRQTVNGHPKCVWAGAQRRRTKRLDALAWWPACRDHQWEDEAVAGLRITEVKIGDRARTNLGDIDKLMTSIAETGLLQPILVTRHNELISGWRRLEACRRLGWEGIPAVLADSLTEVVDQLRAERDETTCREPMAPSEMVALGLTIEELERTNAEARRTEGRIVGGRVRQGQLERTNAAKRKTTEVVADALGVSTRTYERARALVQAAQHGDELAAEQVRCMDETGAITPAYNRWKGLPQAPTGRQQPRTDPDPVKASGARLPRRSQHKAISSALSTINGLVIGLDSVEEIDGAVTKEEAARWARDLSDAVRALRALKRKLGEHANGSQ